MKSKISNHALLPLRGGGESEGLRPLPPAPPLPPPFSVKNQTSKKERKSCEKASQRDPQSPRNLQSEPKMTLRTPSGKCSGTRFGKSLATRGPQEAQRTKTRGLNSNPIEPARSKRSLHFLHKTLKCHRKCLRVWPLWRPFPPKFASFDSKRRARWKYWSHVHSTTK